MAYGDKAHYKDVLTDTKAMEEMLLHTGGERRVPVIVERGKVHIGFNRGA